MLAEFIDRLADNLSLWAIIGFAGQAVFASRFIVQWIHSERVRRSEIPLAFWYISLAGGVVLLVYAVHRADPVFIIGQVTGLFVYARNLHLIYRERRHAAAQVT
jgi:lipid-A-disaccharide synthase-like uncharacterized protein